MQRLFGREFNNVQNSTCTYKPIENKIVGSSSSALPPPFFPQSNPNIHNHSSYTTISSSRDCFQPTQNATKKFTTAQNTTRNQLIKNSSVNFSTTSTQSKTSSYSGSTIFAQPQKPSATGTGGAVRLDKYYYIRLWP